MYRTVYHTAVQYRETTAVPKLRGHEDNDKLSWATRRHCPSSGQRPGALVAGCPAPQYALVRARGL